MSDYQIACYYFPNYHADARNATRYGTGWNEWDLVKRARPRFAGHEQPKVPAWGYEDEADPSAMARKIDAAADHGIDVFLFDWYAYDDGFFLQRALDEGFLGAQNVSRLKFALMWANHDWVELFPARPDRAHREQELHYPGAVTPESFVRITEGVIERYFAHPSYWRLDGRPYFSIYDLDRLVAGFGGLAATRAALDGFRRRASAAGFLELHLNTMSYCLDQFVQQGRAKDGNELVEALGFDSVTTYAWVHHPVLVDSPVTDYEAAADIAAGLWPSFGAALRVPYHPNVSMGWDSTPRCDPGTWHTQSYPYTPVLAGNTPQAFERALRAARAYLAARPASERVLTINAWNEWTEGSYLEPDTQHGMAYLEAIRRVFAKDRIP